MKIKTLFLMGVFISLFSLSAQAQNTIYVNINATGSNDGSSWANAYTNFQTAVNAASSGNEVWVAAGTYQPASGQSFSMKEGVKIYGGFEGYETLLTDRDWEENETVFQGNGNSVIINDNNGLTNNAVIDGFTITSGSGNQGGGIYNRNVSPNFTNLIIDDNQSQYGGGIYNLMSSPSLTNVAISNNTSQSGGGGMSNELMSSPKLTNVTISNNTALIYGGGIYNLESSPILTNVTVINNTANSDGGGMYNNDMSSPLLINVLISNNTSQSNGGGIFNDKSSPILTNVTIADNAANNNGGGIYNNNNMSSPILYNTIILGNNSGVYNISGGSISNSSTHNLIQTGGSSSEANFDGSPANNSTPTDIFNDFDNGDYSLKDGSYAVNAGDTAKYNLYGDAETDLDLAGKPRLFGANIDLGAYEKQGFEISPDANNVLFVKKNATGGGSSWTDALGEVKDALAWADTHKAEFVGNPLQIWVAAETYQPDNDQSFVMVENVKIYGGFEGNETLLTDRDWIENETILQGNGNSVIINYNNGLTATSVLDGFTIIGGNASSGGGIYNFYSSPSLNNVTIANNTADHDGGGIYNLYSSPKLTNVTITNNLANNYGGGIYNEISSPSLINVTFSNNTTNQLGGGMFNYNSSPILTNVTITNNRSQYGGGGINNESSSSPILYNTIILGNNSGISGDISNSSSKNLTQTGNASSGAKFDGVDANNTTPNDIFNDFDNGDYSLKDGSYAVNAGDTAKYNLVGNAATDFDLAGNPRLYQGKIDLGAYENQVPILGPDDNNVLFVKKGETGGGSSWTDAIGEVKDALDWADAHKTEFVGNPLQIWVAAETYQPDNDQSFAMVENVKIYGGFEGNESDLSERNWKTNVTILKGNNNSVIINDNNGLNATSVLDGFTITDGNASSGGGIYNFYSSPSLNNVTIANYAATQTSTTFLKKLR